jgi:hypothetical protein
MTSFMLSHFSYVLFMQLLSQGSADVPALLVEMARAREAATTIEVARVAAMLTVEASALEAIAARHSAAFNLGDAEDLAALVEDRATLAGREALERASREEVENAVTLVSAREDAEGLV